MVVAAAPVAAGASGAFLAAIKRMSVGQLDVNFEGIYETVHRW